MIFLFDFFEVQELNFKNKNYGCPKLTKKCKLYLAFQFFFIIENNN